MKKENGKTLQSNSLNRITTLTLAAIILDVWNAFLRANLYKFFYQYLLVCRIAWIGVNEYLCGCIYLIHICRLCS